MLQLIYNLSKAFKLESDFETRIHCVFASHTKKILYLQNFITLNVLNFLCEFRLKSAI